MGRVTGRPMGRGAPHGRLPEVLTREAGLALAERILDCLGAPAAEVRLFSRASATTSVARGDAHLVTEGGEMTAWLAIDGATVHTTQLDEAGLRAAIATLKTAAREVRAEERGVPWRPERGAESYPTPPQLFYASVSDLTAEARAEVFRAALDATEAAGLVGAGDLTCELSARLRLTTGGLSAYEHGTYAEFSLTARTPDGRGSGWARSGFEDWARIQPAAVIARAVELAQRSAQPVAIEPGRYPVILEPAAVAALLGSINWGAYSADQGQTVFAKEPRGTNKIGLKMLDERLGIVGDPWDPEMPQSTMDFYWNPAAKVAWFEEGVLRNLIYSPSYARAKQRAPVIGPDGVRLFARGPATSLEDMIAATKRGLWVTRLAGVTVMNGRTHLLTGTTRDGTFLIENGRVTKAVKNLRFTESPFFVLNRLEAWGEPGRAARYQVAPRLLLRDFEFTALTEAV